MDLARAEHVHDLEHHEGGEEEREVAGSTTGVVALFNTTFTHDLPISSDSQAVCFLGGIEGGQNAFFDKAAKIDVVKFGALLELVVEGVFSLPNPSLCSSRVNPRSADFIVSSSDVALRDKEFSPEADDHEDDGLPDGVVHDVLHHLAGHKVIVLVLRLALQEGFSGGTSGKSQGGQRVHDEVDPKELDGVEGGLLHDASTDKGDGEGNEVHTQLELEEALDVIVNVTSPLGGLHDSSEVIVLDQDIRSFLAGVGTSNSHSESNISSLECGGIVSTISSDGDGVTQVS